MYVALMSAILIFQILYMYVKISSRRAENRKKNLDLNFCLENPARHIYTHKAYIFNVQYFHKKKKNMVCTCVKEFK